MLHHLSSRSRAFLFVPPSRVALSLQMPFGTSYPSPPPPRLSPFTSPLSKGQNRQSFPRWYRLSSASVVLSLHLLLLLRRRRLLDGGERGEQEASKAILLSPSLPVSPSASVHRGSPSSRTPDRYEYSRPLPLLSLPVSVTPSAGVLYEIRGNFRPWVPQRRTQC